MNYGFSKAFRAGLDLSVSGIQATLMEGTMSSFRFSVGAHGALDIASKEGGSLYGLIGLGYGRGSSKAKTKKEGTEMETATTTGLFSVGLGLGLEALIAQSIGIAIEGVLFRAGTGTWEAEVGEGGGGIKNVSKTSGEATTLEYLLFPSIRILGRIYF